MPTKRYLVEVTAEEREHMKQLVSSGRRLDRTITRARIQLQADHASADRPGTTAASPRPSAAERRCSTKSHWPSRLQRIGASGASEGTIRSAPPVMGCMASLPSGVRMAADLPSGPAGQAMHARGQGRQVVAFLAAHVV